MQQQDGRRGRRPRFAVKDVQAIYIVPLVADGCVVNGHAELLGCAAGITGRRVVEVMSSHNHLNYILTVISTVG